MLVRWLHFQTVQLRVCMMCGGYSRTSWQAMPQCQRTKQKQPGCVSREMQELCPPQLGMDGIKDALQRPPGSFWPQRHLGARHPQQRDCILQRPQIPLLQQKHVELVMSRS